MRTNKVYILSLLIVSTLCMNFRCEKDVITAPFNYTFSVPVDIFPLKKTYSINDTIWIETDLPNKFLFDTKSNQNINADTAMIHFGASFNRFGTSITLPANGFCDVITSNGVNIDRTNSHWGSSAEVKYGCGQPNYKYRIGFKPLYKGTYSLNLPQDRLLESCPGKIIPYYATVSFNYKNVDLNLDVFNSLSKNDRGGDDGTTFYTSKVNNLESFIFKVD